MKYIAILFIFIGFSASAQTYDKPGNWGLQYKRLKVDTLFTVAPTAYALIGTTSLNTSYKLKVVGKSIIDGLRLDGFETVPGAFDGGAALYIRREYYTGGTHDTVFGASIHSIVDRSVLSIGNNKSYASFDAIPGIYSDSIMNMSAMTGFQNNSIWDYPVGSILDKMYGFNSVLVPKTGTVNNIYDFYAHHLDATGSPATIGDHYAFYSEDFAGANTASRNHGIYVLGPTMDNYMAGRLEVDSPTTINSKMLSREVGIGTYDPIADASIEAFTGDSCTLMIQGGYPNIRWKWFYPPTNDSSEFSIYMDNDVTFRSRESGSMAFRFLYNSTVVGRLTSAQRLSIGTQSPTGILHLRAGTASAGDAPIKFTLGTNLTSPEAGAVEYDGNYLYATNNVAVRGIVSVNRTLVSSAITLSLNNDYNHYVFSGTTTTWTLPAVSGTANIKYYIKNRGSGAITLNTTAAANEIYTTTATNTLTINAGEAVEIASDGTFWNLLNQH